MRPQDARKAKLDRLFKEEEPYVKRIAAAVLDRLQVTEFTRQEQYLVAEGLRRAAETLEGKT